MFSTEPKSLSCIFLRRAATDPTWSPGKGDTVAARCACPRRGWMKSSSLGLVIILFAISSSRGDVLSDSDLKKVEGIKPRFQILMVDLVQAAKRPDITSGDTDCIKSTIQELLQISKELSSYEYLMTIEKEITDFGETSPVRGVIKFAIDKSNTILTSERKRLVQLSDQCSRFPLSFGKTQEALQFIDTTTGILNSIQLQH
jgi:hypothetical protein